MTSRRRPLQLLSQCLIVHRANVELALGGTSMGHNTTIGSRLGAVLEGILHVDGEDNSVGTRIPALVDVVAVQKRKLVQVLALAVVGELELLIVAKLVGGTT